MAVKPIPDGDHTTERAPDARFVTTAGEPVALTSLLSAGPLVLVFLRHFG